MLTSDNLTNENVSSYLLAEFELVVIIRLGKINICTHVACIYILDIFGKQFCSKYWQYLFKNISTCLEKETLKKCSYPEARAIV